MLIAQAEREFEETVLNNYPFYIPLPETTMLFNLSEKLMLDYCDQVEWWLQHNCQGLYIAFPSAMGKYSDKSNGVFFKSASDAILFKLSI